jgi:prepilin-type N-terminal cleavage/methylation domain-containing protein
MRGERGQSGFTLLELPVVMVIIGLHTGSVPPRYFGEIGSRIAQAPERVGDARTRATGDAVRHRRRRAVVAKKGGASAPPDGRRDGAEPRL